MKNLRLSLPLVFNIMGLSTTFLEFWAMSILMFIGTFSVPASFAVTIWCVFFSNIYIKMASVLYLVFVYYDRNTGDTGGRGVGWEWFRRRTIWKYLISYFPIDLVKTVDLPADRNYLIAIFPHGVMVFGMTVNCFTSHSKWSTLFPKIRAKPLTIGINFHVPFLREVLFSFGLASVSENSITSLLNQSNDPHDETNRDGYTSNAAFVVVGGAKESCHSVTDTYKLVLKNRKGFVRIALKTGKSLVPAISFGENNVFDIIQHDPNSRFCKFQKAFKRYTRILPIHIKGRPEPYRTLLPRRHPITAVIGAPIPTTKIDNPSEEEVNQLHQLFCERLKDLFETHKSKYVKDSENVQMEFI